VTPKSVTVGPHVYRIVAQRAAIDRASAACGETLVGQCDRNTLTIVVDPSLAASQLADTVLHETLHACFDVIGASEQVTMEIEERLVRALSPVLLDLLRRPDNCHFVDWLREPSAGR
jgi:hypothetical protein